MLIRSKIQEVRGLSAQIARLCLLDYNHLIIEEKQIDKLQNTISKLKDENKLLKALIMVLIAIIILQIILKDNMKNYYGIQMENCHLRRKIRTIENVLIDKN